MTKEEWIKQIKKDTKGVQTYRHEFDATIDTLATILEQRDIVMSSFVRTGGQAVINHKNKSGTSNLVKNPFLCMWADLNRDALQYWRELGLTPSGLKKIKDVAPATDNKTSVSEIMQKIRQETK